MYSMQDISGDNTADNDQKFGELVAQTLELAVASNLSWEEIVTSFGLASKVLATQAAHAEFKGSALYEERARESFEIGIAKNFALEAPQIH